MSPVRTGQTNNYHKQVFTIIRLLFLSVHNFNVLPTVTGTSQSALTTVSVEDLEDSDLSDWT